MNTEYQRRTWLAMYMAYLLADDIDDEVVFRSIHTIIRGYELEFSWARAHRTSCSTWGRLALATEKFIKDLLLIVSHYRGLTRGEVLLFAGAKRGRVVTHN